jgi:hypothetical protein
MFSSGNERFENLHDYHYENHRCCEYDHVVADHRQDRAKQCLYDPVAARAWRN